MKRREECVRLCVGLYYREEGRDNSSREDGRSYRTALYVSAMQTHAWEISTWHVVDDTFPFIFLQEGQDPACMVGTSCSILKPQVLASLP